MEVKYRMLTPSRGLEQNYKSAQNLMTMFELSGVFSEVLLERIYSTIIVTLDALEHGERELCNIKRKEFESLFSTYAIFSEEFKRNCMVIFYSIITVR